MKKIICTYALAGLVIGCTPAENTEPVAPSSPETNEEESVETQPLTENGENEEAVTKMMYMERRDADGNIVGLLDEGLWFKQGDEAPYTGLVVGMNKPKDGKPPEFPTTINANFRTAFKWVWKPVGTPPAKNELNSFMKTVRWYPCANGMQTVMN